MTSLEYYIEQVEQFISALTDDIESGDGTVVTQTKLAVYREVLEHLEEIEQEPSYNSINPELNGDMISRQAVCKIIDDIRDCISVEGYWAFLERLKKLPPVNPTKTVIGNIINVMCVGQVDHRYSIIIALIAEQKWLSHRNVRKAEEIDSET